MEAQTSVEALGSDTRLWRIQGSLDIYAIEHLERTVDPATRHYCVELSQVGCIDSAGWRWIVQLWRQSRQRDGTLILVAVPSHQQRQMSVLGLEAFFTQAGTVDEARTLLSQKSA